MSENFKGGSGNSEERSKYPIAETALNSDHARRRNNTTLIELSSGGVKTGTPEELTFANPECARILQQEERALTSFLKRQLEDSFSDLTKLYFSVIERLEKKFQQNNFKPEDLQIALERLQQHSERVLLQKVQTVMDEYLRSGTEYHLASGRLWAARGHRASFMPFLFADDAELKKKYVHFGSSPRFLDALREKRSRLALDKDYGVIRRLRERLSNIQSCLQEAGLELGTSLADSSVVITLQKETTALVLMKSICRTFWGDAAGGHEQIWQELEEDNPEIFEGAEEETSDFDLRRLPAGTAINISGADPGREFRLMELELYSRSLLLVRRAAQEKQPAGATLQPLTGAWLKALGDKLELEKKHFTKRRSSAGQSASFNAAEMKLLQALSQLNLERLSLDHFLTAANYLSDSAANA